MFKPLLEKVQNPALRPLLDNLCSLFADRMINWRIVAADLDRYIMWTMYPEFDAYGEQDKKEEESLVAMEIDNVVVCQLYWSTLKRCMECHIYLHQQVPRPQEVVGKAPIKEVHSPKQHQERSWPAGMPRVRYPVPPVTVYLL